MPYDPDVIDYFFIMDGDFTMYLIPSRVIAGRVSILLRAYTSISSGTRAGCWEQTPYEAPAEVPSVGSTPPGLGVRAGDAPERIGWCVVRIGGRGGGDG